MLKLTKMILHGELRSCKKRHVHIVYSLIQEMFMEVLLHAGHGVVASEIIILSSGGTILFSGLPFGSGVKG